MRRISPWAMGLALLVMTVVIYLPAMHAGFIWDDDDYVTNNVALRSVDGLWRIWTVPGTTPQFYPMTFISFWMEQQFWGLNPFGYHLVNILLHGANAILAWLLLRQLQLPGAWVAAAIFALHPVHVESVAWVTERKNVLSGAFYLASFLTYLRFADGEKSDSPAPPQWKFYGISLSLYVLALLSKSVTCSLPVAILLVLWWRRGTIAPRDWRLLIPFFVTGVAMGAMTIGMERFSVGARGPEFHLSFLERTLIAGRALWFYMGKLLWPVNLVFIYPRWEIDAGAAWQYIFPVTAAGTLVVLFALRHRIGRGPLAAALFFVATLSPALGFINVYPMRYSFVADHFQYLASLGLIVLAVAIGARACACWRERQNSSSPLVARAAAVTVMAAVGFLTWQQAHIYANVEALWRDTVTMNPRSWMARSNLGHVLLKRGAVDEALAQLQEARRLHPTEPSTHVGVGQALHARSDYTGAIASYQEALRLRPNVVAPYYYMGLSLAQQGNYDEAIANYARALRGQPGLPQIHNSWGIVLAKQEKFADAIVQFTEALRLDPHYADAAENLRKAKAAFQKK